MFGHSDNQQVDNGGMSGQQNPNPIAGALPQNPIAPQPQNNGLGDIPAASDPLPQSSSPFAATPVPDMTPQVNYGSAPSVPIADNQPANDSSDDLLDLKQKALQELSPLVGHLDQNPEEKFKTTMMMIQASDDQALLPAAYEAAQLITDEKAKAQALLDVVNEINYFTQSH